MASPNNLRLAIIGCGAVVDHHLVPALKRVGWVPSVLIDTSPQRIEACCSGGSARRARLPSPAPTGQDAGYVRRCAGRRAAFAACPDRPRSHRRRQARLHGKAAGYNVCRLRAHDRRGAGQRGRVVRRRAAPLPHTLHAGLRRSSIPARWVRSGASMCARASCSTGTPAPTRSCGRACRPAASSSTPALTRSTC